MKQRPRSKLRRESLRAVLLASLTALSLGVFAGDTPARAQNVNLGKQTFKDKADCVVCHGWAADGQPIDPQKPRGSNLRETKLTREQIVETVRCGRPESKMPYYDRFAWDTVACFGMKKDDVGAAMPANSTVNLSLREIEALVDYLQVAVIGRGKAGFEDCEAYYGAGTPYCRTLKPGG